jgi:hypothetical protein
VTASAGSCLEAAIAFPVILSSSTNWSLEEMCAPVSFRSLLRLVRFRDRLVAAKLTPIQACVHSIHAIEGFTPPSIFVLGDGVRHVGSGRFFSRTTSGATRCAEAKYVRNKRFLGPLGGVLSSGLVGDGCLFAGTGAARTPISPGFAAVSWCGLVVWWFASDW